MSIYELGDLGIEELGHVVVGYEMCDKKQVKENFIFQTNRR